MVTKILIKFNDNKLSHNLSESIFYEYLKIEGQSLLKDVVISL